NPCLLLLLNLRNITSRTCGRSGLQNRHIFDSWLADRNLKNRRIRKTRLRHHSCLLGGEVGQTQTCQKKNAGKYSSKTTKKGSRTLTSKYGCRSTRTEGSASIRTLALLQQNQHNQSKGNQQMHHNHNSLQHLISSLQRDRSHRIHSLSERRHR